MTELAETFSPYSELWMLKMMVDQYKKHGRVIVAYDFDDTVYTEKEELKEICYNVCTLLSECSKYPDDIRMVCFTCRGDDTIYDTVIPFLDKMNIAYEKINEQIDDLPEKLSQGLSNKILYTIFLDDYCGLLFTYSVLLQFITWLKVYKGELPDVCGFNSVGLM